MRFHVRNPIRVAIVSIPLVVIAVTVKNLIATRLEYTDENEGVNHAYSEHIPPDNSSLTSLKVPFSPFKPNQPKLIVILTYQRCGSSPVGQFFNTNPNFFYFFEPLDSLYSSLYGIKQGWNIPSDITSYSNGTERILPAIEVEEASRFLRNLLTCEMDALPTETLVNRYFFTLTSDFTASAKYIQCLKSRKRDYKKCENFTQSYCGGRFGEVSESVLATCYRLLRNIRHPANKILPKRIHRRLSSYRLCMNQLRLDVQDSCLPLQQTACSTRKVRVTKVVRASMDSMEPLLRAIPNFRVIHLIRDPRAVALSRKEFDASARGLYAAKANDSMINEAAVYCREVVRDIKTRRRLEQLYPGKIYTVIHDEIFTDPSRSIRDIYRFVDQPVHNKTWEWLHQKRSLSRGLFRWQYQLTFQENKDILHVCDEVFQLARSDKWAL